MLTESISMFIHSISLLPVCLSIASKPDFSVRKMSFLTKLYYFLQTYFPAQCIFITKLLVMKGCNFHHNKKITETQTQVTFLKAWRMQVLIILYLMHTKEPKKSINRELHFHIQSSLKGNYEQRELLRGLLGSNLWWFIDLIRCF